MNDMQSIEREKAVARGNVDSTTMTGLDSARVKPFKFNLNAYAYNKEPANELQLGFFAHAQRALSGTQIALFGNLATDDIAGAQISSFVNISTKSIYGLQVSSFFNVAIDFDGVQASVYNFAGIGKGTQIGVMNIISDTLYGVQGSVLNIARNVSTLQGGVMNIAGDAGLVQGGVMNIAGKVEKLQGGVFNIGGHVGRQIGVINISAESDQTPIGLINIVGNGIFDGTFYVDETGRTGLALHMGTPYFYTIFDYALDPFDTWPQSWGAGLGTRFGMRGNHLSLDYSYINVYNENPLREKHNQLQKIRLGAAYKLLTGVALSSGLTLNALSRFNGDDFYLEPRGEYHWHWTFGDHKVRMWPGLYAGVTVGKF
jgi:hypothetical protein